MPDFSLKLPNLTAEISWSWRMRDSTDDIVVAAANGSAGGAGEWKSVNGKGECSDA